MKKILLLTLSLFFAIVSSSSGSVGGGFIDSGITSLIGVHYGSLVWGDYDNDGDLDLAVSGGDQGNGYWTKIYRNNSGDATFTDTFTDIGAPLTGVRYGALAWGDYDRDGDLDLAVSGKYGESDSAIMTKIYRNEGGDNFADSGATGLTGVYFSSLAWGDFDNDGDLDLALCGRIQVPGPVEITKIYRNNGDNTFTDIGAGLSGAYYGSLVWGDYDNDGDLDLAVSGMTVVGGGITKIYRNDGSNTFIDIGAGLSGLWESSLAWGDYDNDGDLDLAICGYDYTGTVRITKIYQNTNGVFADSGAVLTGVLSGSLAWGDYNNDGKLDLAVSGEESPGSYITKIYRNDGSNTFTNVWTPMTGVAYSSLAWGDYDGDFDLDLAVSGYAGNPLYADITKIYKNLEADEFINNGNHNLNAAPFQPRNPTSQTNNNIILKWDMPAHDDHTPETGLYYNLRVGTNWEGNPANNIVSGVYGSPLLGNYLRPKLSATQLGVTLKNLPLGVTYYWSVQAIDTGFRPTAWFYGGSFADLCITDTSLPAGSIGAAYSKTVSAFGGVGSYTWSLPSGTLPTGSPAFGINPTTGTITGTPTTTTGSPFNFTVMVADEQVPSDTAIKEFSITIYPALAIITSSPLPAGSIGTAYSQIFSATGGVPPYTWGLYNGAPGGGLELNTSTGVFFGTPNTAGTFNFTIRVTDSQGATADKVFSVTINADLSITATTLPAGSIGVPYSKTISATGGAGAYHWSISAGTLPAGLSVDASTGEISGIPTTAGTSSGLTVMVTDSQSPMTDTATLAPLSIVITMVPLDSGISLTGVYLGSLAWGDYDNDGDLDLAVCGYIEGSGAITTIYKNTNGIFNDIGAGLPGVSYSSLAWGDYDNDGDLDLALCGWTGSELITKIYRNNGNDTFAEDKAAVLPGVYLSSLAWGDYDNDGDLDLAVSGTIAGGARVTTIYQNTNGVFADIAASLIGVQYGSLVWGDYDNDGDLDLAVSGDTTVTGTGLITKIYQNNGDNTFAENTAAVLPGVWYGSLVWGDYDNDGDLDLAVCGNTTGSRIAAGLITKIYQNNGDGSFTEDTAAVLTGVYRSSLAWGDYDNDGDLDLAVCGDNGDTSGVPGAELITNIYRNTAGVFTDSEAGLSGVFYGSLAWGDYDNDSDLDLAVCGYSASGVRTKIYKNLEANSPGGNNPNIAPSVPTNLTKNQTGRTISLKWNKGSDSDTPDTGLYYNLRVGTTTDTGNIVSGVYGSPLLGNYLRPKLSATQLGVVLKNLPVGTYYWSVQAIDAGLMKSAWSTEATFDSFDPYNPNGDGFTDVLDLQICINQALGISTPWPPADTNNDGVVNVLDVQRIINRILEY